MMVRRGVSLLEVMFAIGVIAVGLLGVIAVLPLALSQVGRGNVADLSKRVGENAVAEFDMRGMRDPNNWRYAAGGTVGHPSGKNFSFCIDPRFVAANGSLRATPYDARFFPYFRRPPTTATPPPPALPRMVRVSLARIPGALGMMTAMQADQIFVTDDELSFELPDDKTLPPVQVFGGKRKSAGTLSWMATVTPKFDPNEGFKDAYTLSIVIFNRRDVSGVGRNQTMFVDVNADGVVDSGDVPTYNERLAWIVAPSSRVGNPDAANQFHGDGYGGGDITLEAATPEELDLRSGDWIMLMQNLHVHSTREGTPYTPLFRWYRVAETDKPYWDGTQYLEGRPIDRTIAGNSSRPGNYERDVTLIGSDWPVEFSNGNPVSADRIGAIPVTYATLVTGVVAVYEKTIRLETSSLW